MADTFSGTVRTPGKVAVIELRGELNGSSEEPFGRVVDEAIGHDTSSLLLDFAAVDYINSSGIAVIVGILSQQWQKNRRIYAFGLSDHFREIFEITRLTSYIEVHDDEQGAIAAARSSVREGGAERTREGGRG